MRVAHFVAPSLLTAVSLGSPVLAHDNNHVVTRQKPGSYYAITGATGGVFPRLEIRELERAGGEMWNLFLLALTEFQAMDQQIIDSYFQIAGTSKAQRGIILMLIISRYTWYALVSIHTAVALCSVYKS